MSQRDISSLNNQIVLNSGSILDPSNLKSISVNSLKVRNDLLNITEYINGLLYYMFKSLPSGINYEENAADTGLSGNTILSNPNSLSSFGDVFWHSAGEELGRPKTITESLETLESKLIQQQVNISLIERVDLSQLASTVNTASELVYKVKRNTLGADFGISNADFNYTLKEYIYRLYSAIFPGLDIQELNPGESDFPELAFSTTVNQDDIPGCGEFLTLTQELFSIKNIINGVVCDPSFELEFDENIFGAHSNSETTIKQSLELLKDKAIDLHDEVLQNATDISNIETQLAQLAGIQSATEELAGTVELATQDQVKGGVGVDNNVPCVMTADKFCNAITDYANPFLMYSDNSNEIVKSINYAASGLISFGNLIKLRNSFQGYSTVLRTSSPSNTFTAIFKRCYLVDTEGGDVTFEINSFVDVGYGDLIAFINETGSGSIRINLAAQLGTIEGGNTILLDQPYAAITLMMSTSLNRLIVVSRYNA